MSLKRQGAGEENLFVFSRVFPAPDLRNTPRPKHCIGAARGSRGFGFGHEPCGHGARAAAFASALRDIRPAHRTSAPQLATPSLAPLCPGPLSPPPPSQSHDSCELVRHGRCLRHRSARRAGARSAAHAACCAAGYRCTSRCRLAPLVARRQQLRCNAHPWLRRAGRRAARRAPARPQGSCEQRARPREGAAAAGWRLRFEFAPVGEGPDGRGGARLSSR